jgi:hypothetical protein
VSGEELLGHLVMLHLSVAALATLWAITALAVVRLWRRRP